MKDFLEQMASGSRARVQAASTVRPLALLQERIAAAAAPPRLQLSSARFDLIAELKLRSPAAGLLRSTGEDPAGRVLAYARAGAAAVSVLTEPSRFDGELAHLEVAARALAPQGLPAMRKDFLVDPYQLFEARAAGAGGVLVILRLLPRQETEALIECAASLGLFVLLEAFDARDIELMHALVGGHRAAQLLAGVNCRDLATLEVVPQRLLELAPLLPCELPRVAESGVGSVAAARAVAAAGYTLALVGGALMQAADPAALAAELIAAGRAAHR